MDNRPLITVMEKIVLNAKESQKVFSTIIAIILNQLI